MRRFSRRTSFHRRKVHYQWAQYYTNTVGAITNPAGMSFDMLTAWKSANNFSLNLPDIVIWRFHIKISIHYTLSPSTVLATDGVFVASFCDSLLGSSGVQFQSKPYDEQYLIYDKIYTADTMANGANAQSTNVTLYKEYDVRSRRKLVNQNDTLILFVVPQGNVTIGSGDSVEMLARVLLKLPGRG